MDITLTKAEEDFRVEIREFIDEHWPIACRNKTPGTPSGQTQEPQVRAWYDALLERGWAVPSWPIEHGGTDWSPTQRYLWNRETINCYCPERSPFGATMLAPVLYTWGNDSQMERFLPSIREEKMQWCQGYSEPNAGSDLANLQTKARAEKDSYIVNGTKIWTSSAHFADWMFCLVRTNPQANRPQEGISFLLIDMSSPGIEVKPILILGGLHSVNTVTLTNVEVPKGNLVGNENEGWTYAKGLLSHERAGIANVAGSQREIRHLRQYAQETQVRNHALIDQPDFLRKMYQLEIELRALEGLELRTLAAMESGESPGPESSILKIRGTEIAQQIADLQTEVLGWHAIPYPNEELTGNETAIGPDYSIHVLQEMFYGRAASIFGGSNEVQKNIIAKAVLGLS